MWRVGVAGNHSGYALAFLKDGEGMDTKPTNPKDAIGIKKVPFSTVPARVIAEIGLAMLEGAAKYGRHNYRVSGVRASVYYDAAMRHINKLRIMDDDRRVKR